MNRIDLALAAGFLLFLPATASEPGQPMGCEDIQLHVPGLHVRTYAGPSSDPYSNANALPVLQGMDLSGFILNGVAGSSGVCGGRGFEVISIGRFREDGPLRPLFTISGRCVNPSTSTVDTINVNIGGFDWQSGRLFLRIMAIFDGDGEPTYEPTFSLCVIERFRRLSDIYETKKHHFPLSMDPDPIGASTD